MSFWKKLFRSDSNLNDKVEGIEDKSKSHLPLQSERTMTMQALMYKADGRINLREVNEKLFSDAEAWEKLAMSASIFQCASAVINESIAYGNDTQKNAAFALAQAANIIDGAPGVDELVSLYKSAPDTLAGNDWVRLARDAVLQFSRDVPDYLDAAKKTKGVT